MIDFGVKTITSLTFIFKHFLTRFDQSWIENTPLLQSMTKFVIKRVDVFLPQKTLIF